MTDAERIKALFKIAEQTALFVETLNSKLNAEIDGRLEMCMEIMVFVVRAKNRLNALARRVAGSTLFAGDEDARMEFMGNIAQLERECERLEHIIAKATEPDKTEPPNQPSSVG